MEIKAEELRGVVCATPDLLQDASFSIEGWVQRKAARAFRIKISDAIFCGDGVGKPMGILNPQAGIPAYTVAASTPDGQFSWSDLIALSFLYRKNMRAGVRT
jgi:HK97 family phage major capsid protein